MSKNDNQRVLVPRLRFPEFVGQAVRKFQLGDVTAESTIRNGETLPATSVMGVTKAEGIVPMDERLIASAIARYKLVRRNWFAYNPMRLNIGSIARWTGESDILVSPDYVVFRCLEDAEHEIDPAYLDHFRQADGWENFVTEGGDGSVRVRIYYKDIARLQLALPSLAEQQKIADCLGSLDDLITAEGRKLEALRDHKNGLMQQLFPREGETRPRLRFPEVRDAREWEAAKLSSIVDLVSGVHLAPDEYDVDGEVPYFTGPSDFSNDVNAISKWTTESTNIARRGDTLITVKGSGCGELMFLEVPKVAMGRQLMAARPKNCVERFVLYLFETKRKRFEDLASGNLIPGLSRGDILDLESPLPKEEAEQQRIADCLAALDAMITAQAEKLDSLRTHKRGLMQQLFPIPEA